MFINLIIPVRLVTLKQLEKSCTFCRGQWQMHHRCPQQQGRFDCCGWEVTEVTDVPMPPVPGGQPDLRRVPGQGSGRMRPVRQGPVLPVPQDQEPGQGHRATGVARDIEETDGMQDDWFDKVMMVLTCIFVAMGIIALALVMYAMIVALSRFT